MTDSTADSDDFAGILSLHPLAAREDDERKRNIRRGLAIAAVVLVHLVAVILIAYSYEIPIVLRIRETIPEAITWIPMPKRPQPQRTPEQQRRDEETLPVFPQTTAPITLPPAPRRSQTPSDSDALLGVGRSIACGASSYENLSAAQRESCRRHPWNFVKKADGTMVLDVPKGEAPPTTMDLMRHEQQTAPPCPVLSNTPCLGKVIHGGGLGGGAAPF